MILPIDFGVSLHGLFGHERVGHGVFAPAFFPLCLSVLVIGQKLEFRPFAAVFPIKRGESLRVFLRVVETFDQHRADEQMRVQGKRGAKIFFHRAVMLSGCRKVRPVVPVLEVEDQSVEQWKKFGKARVRRVALDRGVDPRFF